MILDDYEDEELDQIIDIEKDKQQDEAIDTIEGRLAGIDASINELKKSDSDLEKKVNNNKIKALGNEAAITTINSTLDGLTDGLSDAQGDIAVLQGQLKSEEEARVQSDNEISERIEALKQKVETEEVEADIVNASTIIATNLSVENLTQNEISAEEITTDKAKIEEAEVDTVVASVITGKDSHVVTDSLVNDELFHIHVPKYDGDVNITADNYELNLTVLNNTLVTFNQNNTYLYRVAFNSDGTDLYFSIAFNYHEVHIGNGEYTPSSSEEVDKVFYENNVNTLTGVVSATEFQYGDGTNLQVVVVDELPEGGVKNVIYVVNGYKSFYCDGERMYPMTTEVTEDIDFGTLIGEEM